MNEVRLRWYHRLYVGLQYLLPHHLLSALMRRVTRVRWRPFKDLMIRSFVPYFGVDMAEAETPDPSAYTCFNDFFTRALRTGARPIAGPQDRVVCPADGALSQLGTITQGRIFQAKGRDYSLLELLSGDRTQADQFANGSFATIYLSPRDYHRVHMPVGGNLREMAHVPGRLFSVNPVTTALVPRLFSRNERVVCLFDGDAGPFAVILVGAIFVGSIDTVWAGRVTPAAGGPPSQRYKGEEAIRLDKGDEMGRFNMGSTVILLFPPETLEWEPELAPGDKLHMGNRLGKIRTAHPR